jgi:hypothetical protein
LEKYKIYQKKKLLIKHLIKIQEGQFFNTLQSLGRGKNTANSVTNERIPHDERIHLNFEQQITPSYANLH